MTLTTTVNFQLTGKVSDILSVVSGSPKAEAFLQATLANGNLINQANKVWADSRTLAATTTEDLDLTGSLEFLGIAFNPAKLKALVVINNTVDPTAILRIGNAGANPFVDWIEGTNPRIKIGPGGAFFLWNPSLAGYVITAGAADVLMVDNQSAVSIQYDIIAIGAD